jgi:hypothetical protein
MPEPPRTVKYEGLYPSQLRERFEEDARAAALDDWYPVSESWQGAELFVVYERDPDRHQRPEHHSAPAHAPAPRPTGGSPASGDPAGSRAPMPRTLTAVLVGAVVLGAGAVAMIGLGSWDRPGTAPGNPVRFATPAPGRLGPRADAIAFFESRSYTGAVMPTGDGQERWLGRDAAGSLAELVGPASALVGVALTVFPEQDVGVGEIAQPTDVLLFLDRFVPGSVDWATSHTDDAIAYRGAPVRQRFGDRILALSALSSDDSSVFTYAITQAEAPRMRSRRTPRPAARARTFSDGTWLVGSEIEAGTYRATAEGLCSWSRLSGTTGAIEEVIAGQAGTGSRVVTIARRDKAFSSSGCGRWTSDLSRITTDRTAFGDGTYLVGEDIAAGTYLSSGDGTCAWARLRGFGGTEAEVIAGAVASGPLSVTIRASDEGFTSSGCGGWARH